MICPRGWGRLGIFFPNPSPPCFPLATNHRVPIMTSFYLVAHRRLQLLYRHNKMYLNAIALFQLQFFLRR